MTTGLVVRPATLADLPALHSLADRAVSELLVDRYTAAQLTAVRRAKGHEVEPALIASGNYYVAAIDGLVVAGSGWSPDGRFAPIGPLTAATGTATMRATYVDPAWSRRGLALLLAQTTETVARTAGFTRFEALCTPLSERLRLRMGYTLIGRRDLPVADGLTVPGAHMRKILAVT